MITKENMNEFDRLLHDIITVAFVLKSIENCLTEGQQTLIDGCITRLHEIRQKLLESVEE